MTPIPAKDSLTGLQVHALFKHYAPMPRYNHKDKIRGFYDRVSPYYLSLWGQHIHHGYWVSGDETKEQAQLQLVDYLVSAAQIPPNCTILDIGCGFGGSSIHLAKHYGANATGITISPVQVEMANRAAANAGVSARFLHMDAEAMTFEKPFDVLWSVESISHYQDHAKFFSSAAKLLKPGGTMAITDWFKKDGLTPAQHKKFLQPIEKGMLVELRTMEKYAEVINASGLTVVKTEVLNKNCAKSWDITLDITRKKEFWKIAARMDFVHHLKSFKAMRNGFATGNFVYGLMVAKNCSSSGNVTLSPSMPKDPTQHKTCSR
jgi:tocopherol O-methyltransferase